MTNRFALPTIPSFDPEDHVMLGNLDLLNDDVYEVADDSLEVDDWVQDPMDEEAADNVLVPPHYHCLIEKPASEFPGGDVSINHHYSPDFVHPGDSDENEKLKPVFNNLDETNEALKTHEDVWVNKNWSCNIQKGTDWVLLSLDWSEDQTTLRKNNAGVEYCCPAHECKELEPIPFDTCSLCHQTYCKAQDCSDVMGREFMDIRWGLQCLNGKNGKDPMFKTKVEFYLSYFDLKKVLCDTCIFTSLVTKGK
jgi:hypothetical protein